MSIKKKPFLTEFASVTFLANTGIFNSTVTIGLACFIALWLITKLSSKFSWAIALPSYTFSVFSTAIDATFLYITKRAFPSLITYYCLVIRLNFTILHFSLLAMSPCKFLITFALALIVTESIFTTSIIPFFGYIYLFIKIKFFVWGK